jgi:hypothetical protein
VISKRIEFHFIWHTGYHNFLGNVLQQARSIIDSFHAMDSVFEELKIAQLDKNSVFYENVRFITLFTTARQWALS